MRGPPTDGSSPGDDSDEALSRISGMSVHVIKAALSLSRCLTVAGQVRMLVARSPWRIRPGVAGLGATPGAVQCVVQEDKQHADHLVA